MQPSGEQALDREAMDQPWRQHDRGVLSAMGCRKGARARLKTLGAFGVDGVERGRVISLPDFRR
jgi:hypothetical protein